MSGAYTEVSKLVGSSAIGKSEQGTSVILSEDGNFLLICGPNDGNMGAVWFYQKISGVWTQKQKIVPTGYSGYPYFGISIAVNPSMNTLIVGAYGDNANIGASFVFTFDGTTWTQEAKLVGNGASLPNLQGYDVALSADANTAISGGPGDANFVGAAWIFVRTNITWSQQGSKLVGSGFVGQPRQGWSVALSSDGILAVVGGFLDNSGKGALWIFLRKADNSWNQVGTKITATDEIGGGQFGISLALSGDDQTLVVGGWRDNWSTGAMWIFKRNGNTFLQFGNKLVGVGAILPSNFGASVTVNKLGTLVAVGAYGDSSGVGAVFTYFFDGTQYKQFGNKILAPDAIGQAQQGSSVALDGLGSQLLFEGWNDNATVGAAWIYVNTAITNSPSLAPTAPTIQPSFVPTTQPSVGPVDSSSSSQMLLGLPLMTSVILLAFVLLCVCVTIGFCVAWRKLKGFQKRTDAMEIMTWITHSGNKADINLSHKDLDESFDDSNPMRG